MASAQSQPTASTPTRDRLIHALAIEGRIILAAIVLWFLYAYRPREAVWSSLPLFVALMALFFVAPRAGFGRLWLIYASGITLFNIVRVYADEVGNPVRYSYPIDIAHHLFGGAVGSVWLQDHLYQPGQVSFLTVAAIGVYASFFLLPHIIGLLIVRRRPSQAPAYLLALVATLFIGLIGYAALPTAPPWLAGQAGHLPMVHRIIPEVAGGQTYSQATAAIGSNDVGAMPSLHLALAAMVAIGLAVLNRRLRIVGALYVLAMGFSLVYLGEHYVVDEVAGLATALVAWQATKAILRAKAPLQSRRAPLPES